MADIGSAGLLIVPHFDGLSQKVNQALGSVDASQGGCSIGQSLSDGVGEGTKGLAKSGALVGAFSAITTKAMDLVTSHVGSAAARLDTLKNYPTVMQSLGVSADEAQGSIQTMSDRLSNLPTRLDSMASTVQGLYAATKDYGVSLTTATDAGLALNDMLLAGGQGTQVVNSAMEQFRQMLAKGKPDMQDWRALISAAPGQMDQLAKSMLGPTANANDLYAALGGGGGKATISMGQLLDAMIRLDTKGGAGLASLSDQAQQATGGIQTAMDNASNAVTKGLSSVMGAVGRNNIAGAINDVRGAIADVFGDLTSVATKASPVIKQAWSGLSSATHEVYQDVRPLAPAIAAVVAANKGIGAATTAWGALGGAMGGLGAKFSKAGDVVGRVGEKMFDSAGALGDFGGIAERAGLRVAGMGGALGKVGAVLSGPWGVAIAAGVAGLSLLVGHLVAAKQRNDEWSQSMSSVADSTRSISGLSSYSDALQATGEQAQFTAMSVDELKDSIDKHQSTIQDSIKSAQTTIATLDTAQGIISDYAGKTDLTTDAQGKLRWALEQVNDQLGTSITMADMVANTYTDQDGNVQTLTTSLGALIEKKKEEARVDALTASLTEAYKQQAEAARTLTEAQDAYDSKLQDLTNTFVGYGQSEEQARRSAEAMLQSTDATGKKMYDEADALDKASDAYQRSTDQVDALNDSLGAAAEAADSANDAYSSIASGMPLVEARLQKGGSSLSDFRRSLSDLGADSGQLSKLSEKDMLAIAGAYDGTSASIVDALGRAGVGIDSTKAKTARLASEVSGVLSEFGDAAQDAASELGVSMGDMATSLANAGVSTSQLRNIGSENFAALAKNAGGDMNRLVAMVCLYNQTPVLDKDGSIRVNETQLIDAQGNLYTWNGTQLLDKSGRAVVNDVDLIDAQGNVVRWNGTALASKFSIASVSGNATNDSAASSVSNTSDAIRHLPDRDARVNVYGNYGSAASSVWNLKNAIDGIYSKEITVTERRRAVYTTNRNARGGIRPHADGAIVTRETPLDVVGEDGAEAIVPLTNRRYSQPFADVIAESMAHTTGGETQRQLLAEVAALRRELGRTIRDNAPTATPREFGRMVRAAV